MNINTNIIDFVWNFKNFKLKDFGLDSEYNMLCARVCECGCGEKMNVLLKMMMTSMIFVMNL